MSFLPSDVLYLLIFCLLAMLEAQTVLIHEMLLILMSS